MYCRSATTPDSSTQMNSHWLCTECNTHRDIDLLFQHSLSFLSARDAIIGDHGGQSNKRQQHEVRNGGRIVVDIVDGETCEGHQPSPHATHERSHTNVV